MLRKITWAEGSCFKVVVEKYRDFMMTAFGHCSLVFDGYSSTPSTKDHEHE